MLTESVTFVGSWLWSLPENCLLGQRDAASCTGQCGAMDARAFGAAAAQRASSSASIALQPGAPPLVISDR